MLIFSPGILHTCNDIIWSSVAFNTLTVFLLIKLLNLPSSVVSKFSSVVSEFLTYNQSILPSTMLTQERTLCNRWFLFTLLFILHLSLLLLETICLITVSSTENPLTSCCTALSYPGSSSAPSPGSQQILSLLSFSVPSSLWLGILSCRNYQL